MVILAQVCFFSGEYISVCLKTTYVGVIDLSLLMTTLGCFAISLVDNGALFSNKVITEPLIQLQKKKGGNRIFILGIRDSNCAYYHVNE